MLQKDRQKVNVFKNDAFQVGLLGIFRERGSRSNKPRVAAFPQNVWHARCAGTAENAKVINFLVQSMRVTLINH